VRKDTQSSLQAARTGLISEFFSLNPRIATFFHVGTYFMRLKTAENPQMQVVFPIRRGTGAAPEPASTKIGWFTPKGSIIFKL